MTSARRMPTLAAIGAAALATAMAGEDAASPWPDAMPRVPGAREYFVAPNGNPDAAGTKQEPFDLKTPLTKPGLLNPGDIVWIAGGTYEAGAIKQDKGVCGEPGKPVLFRAVPGERATVRGGIEMYGSHVWLWGLEFAGAADAGVNMRAGDGVKLINLVVRDNGTPLKEGEQKHPTGQGVGGWDVGDDHEFYGNLLYANGGNSLDHGIYSQNTATHTLKKYVDNIVFENAGCGFHIYGQSPTLCGFHLEGNIAFSTSLHPKSPGRGQMNILCGGTKPISKVTLKGNCTYHSQAESKRGVDIGYTATGCRDIVVEDNYFTCGAHALQVKGVSGALTVRNNTFWSPADMVLLTLAPDADRKSIVWDGNTYIANGKFDLEAWKKDKGVDANSKLLEGKDGRPEGLFVFKRVNRYEPRRVHLAVYNWDRQETVTIDLAGILDAGDKYRVVNVVDYFGEPAVSGAADGPSIRLPMKGHRYEPEFGAYVLFRERPAKP